MAAKTAPMFKIGQMAKDLGMKTKDLCASMEEYGIPGKTATGSLEADEFNLFFERITAANQIKDIDGYMAGKTVIRTPEVMKAAAEREEAERLKREKEEAEKKAAEARAASEKKEEASPYSSGSVSERTDPEQGGKA